MYHGLDLSLAYPILWFFSFFIRSDFQKLVMMLLFAFYAFAHSYVLYFVHYFLRSIQNKIWKHSSMTFLRLKTSSSVYTDEVLIPSTEFFKFMHRLDEGIQSKECAKYLFVTHIFPVFILIDELMWQTKSSS